MTVDRHSIWKTLDKLLILILALFKVQSDENRMFLLDSYPTCPAPGESPAQVCPLAPAKAQLKAERQGRRLSLPPVSKTFGQEIRLSVTADKVNRQGSQVKR